MEDPSPLEEGAVLNCSNCGATVKPEEKFCSNCSYPHNGTPEEKSKFQSRIRAKKNLLDIVEKEVRKAKITLVVLGVLSALAGVLFGLVLEDDIGVVVVYGIIAIVYFGLSIWSDKQPFGAILTALILYGTLILVNAAIDPATLFSGLLWKIIIISIFVKGLKSGNEARKVMKELEELGIRE